MNNYYYVGFIFTNILTKSINEFIILGNIYDEEFEQLISYVNR